MNTRWQYIAGLGIICGALLASVASAQTPPAGNRDDLDVTMRVIVDPDAKVPDEIVHRIPLPKPALPAGGPAPGSDKSDKTDKGGKPSDPGAKGVGGNSAARDSGREFGQQTAEQARQRSEETRRNNKPPDKPPGPPGQPPGRPPEPPRGPPGG